MGEQVHAGVGEQVRKVRKQVRISSFCPTIVEVSMYIFAVRTAGV